MAAAGGRRLLALAVATWTTPEPRLVLPCGLCRQIYEDGGDDMLVVTDAGTVTLGELYPEPFGPGGLKVGQVGIDT